MRVYGGMPVRQETGDMAMERQLPVIVRKAGLAGWGSEWYT